MDVGFWFPALSTLWGLLCLPAFTMASGLSTLTPTQLRKWQRTAQAATPGGTINKRIPRLATADPTWFAVHVQAWPRWTLAQGDTHRSFPLLSLIHPFLLLYLLEQSSYEAVFERVGLIPADPALSPLAQLKADQGYPRNPLLASGAMVLCDLIPGKDGPERGRRFLRWLQQRSNCRLRFDSAMLGSIWHAPPNLAIMRHLANAGHLQDGDRALDTYERLCSLVGQVEDVAQLGQLLALPNAGIRPHHRRVVNGLMLTCGLGGTTPRYAVEVGLPMAGSISGALLAVVPRQGAIAAYGPALNRAGYSGVGLTLVAILAGKLGLSPLA